MFRPSQGVCGVIACLTLQLWVGGARADTDGAPSGTTSKPTRYDSRPSGPKTIALVSLYSATGVSLVASGVFGWKSLAKRNEADTEAELNPPGFCVGLAAPACVHYTQLREEQNAFALRAWGLLGLSSVFALSSLAIGEYWPNERYAVTASIVPGVPGETAAELSLGFRMDL